MSKLILCTIIAYFIFAHRAKAQDLPSGNETLVPVTNRFAASKRTKQHTYRLEVLPHNNLFSMSGFGFSRLPRSLRVVKFSDGKVQKKNMLQQYASQSLDSVYKFLQETQQKPS